MVEDTGSLQKIVITPLQHHLMMYVDFRTHHSQIPIYLIKLCLIKKYTGSSTSKDGRVNDKGLIIYSFILNILPQMSYGVLECDMGMLQNYTLMTL